MIATARTRHDGRHDMVTGSIDPIPREQEWDLIRRYQQNGDQEARDRLVRANLRFVASIAQEYWGRGIEPQELIALGCVGLLKAIERFDPDAGWKFISYAVWWIRQTILAELAQGELVRRPLNGPAVGSRMRKAEHTLAQATGRQPDPRAVARAAGVSDADPLAVEQRIVSLDGEIHRMGGFPEPDDGTYAELLPDGNAPDPEQDAEAHETRALVAGLLGRCTKRERLILRHYYGLAGAETLNLQQIGQQLHLTRERVRQIRNEALGRLRRHCPDLETVL